MAVNGRKVLRFDAAQVKIWCCSCDIAFSVPANWNRERMDDHESFFCPNGHKQSYQGQSEAEKLRDELLARTEELTSLKNRIANGVCPCCNRTFVNLGRHIGTKHPQFMRVEPSK